MQFCFALFKLFLSWKREVFSVLRNVKFFLGLQFVCCWKCFFTAGEIFQGKVSQVEGQKRQEDLQNDPRSVRAASYLNTISIVLPVLLQAFLITCE